MRSNERWVIAVLAAAAVLVVAFSSHAQARRALDRPAGLADGQWIPLGPRLGLVISDWQPGTVLFADGPGWWLPRSPALSVSALPRPPGARARVVGCPPQGVCRRHSQGPQARQLLGQLIDGYFMVRVDGRWMRLSIVAPPQVLRAAQAHAAD